MYEAERTRESQGPLRRKKGRGPLLRGSPFIHALHDGGRSFLPSREPIMGKKRDVADEEEEVEETASPVSKKGKKEGELTPSPSLIHGGGCMASDLKPSEVMALRSGSGNQGLSQSTHRARPSVPCCTTVY